MGSGIAQVAACAGFKTVLFDLNATILEKAGIVVEESMRQQVKKGSITEEAARMAFSRITFTRNISDCRADFIMEAIVEDLSAKVGLFNQLGQQNPAGTIYTTNTSSLSISVIASKTAIGSCLAGMHFFNPAIVMKLVEIIPGNQTDPAVLGSVKELALAFGKTPVICRDVPGFIVNRVARPYYLEALRLVENQDADFRQIDELLESTGFKMGPFRLMDLIGIDVNNAVSRIVWEALGKPLRLHPSALQQKKVDAGELGRKSGAGFYSYSHQ